MLAGADSRAVLCHVNLARGFRGGERQTELLVRALAGTVPHQRLIFRTGQPLGSRVDGVPGVETRAVGGKAGAVGATGGAALIHAHETAGAQVALLRHWLSSTPYVITRRVDNVPRSDPFTRAMYRRAARTVALSRAIERALSSYDASIATCRIPSACSSLPFDRAAAGRLRAEHSDKFLVGHVAAIDFAHKGQLSLIEAAGRLEHTHPELHFVLVGAGGDEQRARRLAERLPNVSFTGWVANVGDYLAAFDMFVLPSEREGLGSILLDAMQFGLPIVATAVGGIPDVITDDVNGLLVPARDADALAAAIAALAADPARRAAMAEANRKAAREYHPSVMAARYVELYRELNPALVRAEGVDA
jgi:glycosyltransferase involved in cell wall biosynthesis